MVYIILGTGFEEMEAICPCDILRRGGVEAKLAGIGGTQITGGNGITVQADCTVEEMDLEEAIVQMEMLSHTFFVYKDSENGDIAIVYKRNDGRYGLLEVKD